MLIFLIFFWFKCSKNRNKPRITKPITKQKGGDRVKLVYLAGQLVGVVVQEHKNTLLIRKAFVTDLNGKRTIAITEKAVFVEKVVIDETQSKLVDVPENESIEPINMARSIEFIREFLNV